MGDIWASGSGQVSYPHFVLFPLLAGFGPCYPRMGPEDTWSEFLPYLAITDSSVGRSHDSDGWCGAHGGETKAE